MPLNLDGGGYRTAMISAAKKPMSRTFFSIHHCERLGHKVTA
jgi:hypothetical protein